MTAPQIPDAAVEAYLRATAQTSGACGADEYVANCRTWAGGLFWEDTRAGLAAALPHLLPAAPSGETAPQPCGHTIAGVLGRLLMCSRPAGHDGAHGDASGAQWAEVPPGEEVDAAQVPAAPDPRPAPMLQPVPFDTAPEISGDSPRYRTRAQATPLTPAEIKQAAADCRDQIIAAAAQAIGRARTNAQATTAGPAPTVKGVMRLIQQYGDACRASDAREAGRLWTQISADLWRLVWEDEPPAAGDGVAAASVPAAPNAQATPDHLPLSAIQPALDAYLETRRQYARLKPISRGDLEASEVVLHDAGLALAEAVRDALAAAPSGEQPTEPAGEVDQ